VRLIERDEAGCTFYLAKREQAALFQLLGRYPVLSAAAFAARKARPGAKADAEERGHQELLQEALAGQQNENRRQLEAFLKEKDRFQPKEKGLVFKVSAAELEWLLQVVNDIRVGSWMQLGEPDLAAQPPFKFTVENLRHAAAMESAGLVQHILLSAAQG